MNEKSQKNEKMFLQLALNGIFGFPKLYFLLAFSVFYNWLYGMAVFQCT